MGKDKLRRFEEIKLFKNVSEFIYNTPFNNSNWTKFLKDNNPGVLELGCGKGEYTVNLAKEDKSKNFIGIDLKGNRLYIGAKQAIDQNLENVHFLRSRIDLIDQCFDQNSVDEIWLTFSDPQPKKPRKRLSSPLFIDRYKKILKT